jgi:uncharacterized protein YjbI with pentapeptide repeats
MPAAADPPASPDLPAELAPGAVKALAPDGEHAEIELAGAALTDQHAANVSFEAARLRSVDLSQSSLERLSLVDCELSGCNLSNLRASGADVGRVAFDNCRLTGLALPDATLRDATFRGCRVDLASFSFSRLERVTFDDCVLAQADFLEAKLRSVRFHGCDLTRADFRGVRLERCELRRSDLTGAQGIDSLRGAALEWADIVDMAGVWATALGLEVLEDEAPNQPAEAPRGLRGHEPPDVS